MQERYHWLHQSMDSCGVTIQLEGSRTSLGYILSFPRAYRSAFIGLGWCSCSVNCTFLKGLGRQLHNPTLLFPLPLRLCHPLCWEFGNHRVHHHTPIQYRRLMPGNGSHCWENRHGLQRFREEIEEPLRAIIPSCTGQCKITRLLSIRLQ